MNDLINKIDWNKCAGLVPAIIQDGTTGAVLMLGYMNAEALEKTIGTRTVTFFSRTKNRLWTKGETSGHTLELQGMKLDCDADTLLVTVKPNGPTCHTGTTTCFGETAAESLSFLETLTGIIKQRATAPAEGSYTAKLLSSGILKMAQKVGEEGVEVALAAAGEPNEKLKDEAADLLFHLMVLLEAKGLKLVDIAQVLRNRHQA